MENLLNLFGDNFRPMPARGPSRDRRLRGKARIRARRAQNAANRQGTTAEPQPILGSVGVAKHGLRELEEMAVPDLKHLAKSMGLKGYSKMKKDDLIEFIYRSDQNEV